MLVNGPLIYISPYPSPDRCGMKGPNYDHVLPALGYLLQFRIKNPLSG